MKRPVFSDDGRKFQWTAQKTGDGTRIQLTYRVNKDTGMVLVFVKKRCGRSAPWPDRRTGYMVMEHRIHDSGLFGTLLGSTDRLEATGDSQTSFGPVVDRPGEDSKVDVLANR